MDAHRLARPAAALALALALAFGLALATMSGCISDSGPSPGFEAWQYTNAQYVGVAGATLDRTWKATLAALDQMGLTVRSKTRERLRADISAVRPDGTNIQIALSRQSPDFTRVTVQVGLLGDEAESKAIVAKIKAGL